MKKHLITAIAIALLAFGGYFGYTTQYGDSDLTELQLMNIEALTHNEYPFLDLDNCFAVYTVAEGLEYSVATVCCSPCRILWTTQVSCKVSCKY